ncbi:MAG: VWA domain-containing protein [Planctomycetota bacterium]|nr:VWA domain-containing protein [Planctomycetota bacterium]
MDWLYPHALYLLWLAPLWVGLMVYARARKKRAAEAYVAAQMHARILPGANAERFWLKTLLVAAALVFAVLALARPRWGEYMLEVRQRGCDLYVLLDVSKSMLASDVPPSRLQRAKDDIKVLLTRLNGERVGLIAFAGRPVVKCPLTGDYGFFRLALDETDTGSAPRGGTAIGDAIRKALEVLPKEGDRDQALLLITDGEDHDSFLLDAADAAAERKVAVFAVGLGDAAQGARVPVKAGGQVWLSKDGQQVWSKLHTDNLEKIAQRTNGAFVPAGTKAYDLGQIYADHLAKLRGESGSEVKRKRLQERFQIFLAIALLLLMLDLAILPYPPRTAVASEKPKRSVPAKAVVAALLLLALSPAALRAEEPAPEPKTSEANAPASEPPAAKDTEPGKDAPDLVAEGMELYQKKEYAGAGEKFAAAETRTLEHERATVAFDLGAALQKKGERAKALERYEEAGRARDKRIATAARFNMGCLEADEARALAGEKPEDLPVEKRAPVLDAMARAVTRYRECLDLDANHEGARRNLELLREWVKYYTELWRKKDREKRRKEMDLLAFLEYLMATQDGLKSASEQLGAALQAPVDAFAELKRGQDELMLEIPALKEKIEQSATPPQQPGAPPPKPDPQAEQAVTQLKDWAEQSGRAMAKASEKLEARVAGQAAEDQRGAWELLGKIWESAAPFRKLLEYNLQNQTKIVKDLAPDPGAAPAAPLAPLADKVLKKETEELARLQERVSRRTQVMGERARIELEELAQAPAQPQAAPQPGQPQPPDPEKVKAGLKKAVELAPKAVVHEEASLRALRKEDRIAAYPEAEEARKILEEIAKAQPQDENKDKQDQNKDRNKDQNQDQQDPQKKDQDKQDKKDEDKKSEEKSQDPSKDGQDKKSGEQKSDSKDGQDGKEPPKPRELSPQQAEALLRKVQERERDRRKKLEELKALMGGQEPVDKDW